MKIYNLMQERGIILSNKDTEEVLRYVGEGIELIMEAGRIYTEAGTYVADYLIPLDATSELQNIVMGSDLGLLYVDNTMQKYFKENLGETINSIFDGDIENNVKYLDTFTYDICEEFQLELGFKVISFNDGAPLDTVVRVTTLSFV